MIRGTWTPQHPPGTSRGTRGPPLHRINTNVERYGLYIRRANAYAGSNPAPATDPLARAPRSAGLCGRVVGTARLFHGLLLRGVQLFLDRLPAILVSRMASWASRSCSEEISPRPRFSSSSSIMAARENVANETDHSESHLARKSKVRPRTRTLPAEFGLIGVSAPDRWAVKPPMAVRFLRATARS